MKILLKNGKLYDGSGAPAVEADLLIDSDRIAWLGAPGACPAVPDEERELAGFSIAPHDSPHRDCVGAGLFHNDAAIGSFATMDEFFDAVDENSPANIAACIRHCSVRAGICGYENRPLTSAETQSMLGVMDTA
ncbi:MAG: hypothetical protein LBS53_13275 [Synergistaceae bacterium]|nr:hypothetical protein [Synergistaceae bacterium]